MVFCFQNISDLQWEKFVLLIEKTLEIQGCRPKICTGTIYTNNEKSVYSLSTQYLGKIQVTPEEIVFAVGQNNDGNKIPL